MTTNASSNPARGLYFEELNEGEVFHSDTRMIAEADIVDFARVSGDDNPVHTDPEYAKRTVFRGCVAHGALSIAVATGLGWRTGIFKETLQAIVENNAKLVLAVRAGDVLRLELEVAHREESPTAKRGLVKLLTRLVNQNDAVVVSGNWLCLFKRMPSG
jgi:acyl dehydratase